MVLKEGGVGIFGFADLANCWFGFSVFALKNCGFSVSVFRAVCGFSPIMPGFGFRFLSTMMAVFRILLPNSFYGFSDFAEEVTPRSRAKTVIPRDHLQLEECMASLVSLAALFGS